MRVTTNTYTDSLVAHLNRIGQRHTQLQNQVATGQRVQTADDDPLAMQQVLQLRDNAAGAAQYQKNIQNHQDFAQATHGILRSLAKIVDRAQEIAVRIDATESDKDLKSYAAEVSQLLKKAVQDANSKYRGEYLLGGTKSNVEPFTATFDAEGLVNGVTFNGTTDLPASEIAVGETVTSRLVGANDAGDGDRGLLTDSRFGADLFGHLITLQNQLLSGDKAGVAATRAELQNDEENILFHVAGNASLQTRLEGSLSSTKDEAISIEKEISRRADVDIAETIVRLNQAQTSYQAALQRGGTILNMNLLDFLR